MSYTTEQIQAIRDAKTRHQTAGRPEVAAKIDYLVSLEAPYAKIWELASGDVKEMVRPETPITDIIPPPPATGPNSTTDAWRKFAHKVSDIEPEIIDSLGRNDLITILVDRGVIEAPEFVLGASNDEEE